MKQRHNRNKNFGRIDPNGIWTWVWGQNGSYFRHQHPPKPIKQCDSQNNVKLKIKILVESDLIGIWILFRTLPIGSNFERLNLFCCPDSKNTPICYSSAISSGDPPAPHVDHDAPAAALPGLGSKKTSPDGSKGHPKRLHTKFGWDRTTGSPRTDERTNAQQASDYLPVPVFILNINTTGRAKNRRWVWPRDPTLCTLL